MDAWTIWMVIALITLLLEIFTSGFAVICFSIGAVAAAITSHYVGGGDVAVGGILALHDFGADLCAPLCAQDYGQEAQAEDKCRCFSGSQSDCH